MAKRFAYAAFIILLLILVPTVFVGSVRDAALRAVGPLGSFLISQNSRVGNFLQSIGEIHTLREDKQRLQQQVLELQQELANNENVARENTALRQELGVTSVTRSYQKVLGHVIVRGNDQLDDTVTIDVGSEQGLAVDQPAVYQGSLVGKVIDVRKNSSIVRLITSRESVVQAWVAETREKGLVVGDGNNAYLIDITQGVTVAGQSIIETSGLGGSLPQGILVGQVGEVQSKQSELSQRFLATLPRDPATLESVFILLTDVR